MVLTGTPIKHLDKKFTALRYFKRHQACFFLLLLFFVTSKVFPQPARVDSSAFFTEEKLIEITLTTDFKTLFANKKKMQDQPATLSMRFPDSTTIPGEVNIRARGITRKETCLMPPLMVNFKSTASGLSPLGKIKLVCGCNNSPEEERLVLKEYLVYKLYNLLTEMSFRVRLVRIHYLDSKGKRKPYTQYGFFIEDVDALARRNGCREINNTSINQRSIQEKNISLVEIFQYMVGNTDWSVSNYHNIKLIRSKKHEQDLPIAVPYDFDYCGLVNAYYAVPSELLSIKKVTEREFRGFPRSPEVLQETISVFIKQKEAVFRQVADFTPLAGKYKDEIINYLKEFYSMISDPQQVQREFIDNARKN